MKCKHCGKDLMDGAKFCVYCGKPIEAEEVKKVEPVPNTIDPFATLDQKPQEVQQPIANESIADEQLTQVVVTEDPFATLDQKSENTNNQTELVQPLVDSIQEIKEVQKETKVEEQISNIVKEEVQSTLPVDNKKEGGAVQTTPSPIEMPKEPQKQDINIETKIVKKNNPILIVIIFILLAIIVGGGFFVYTKYIEPSGAKKTSNNQTTNVDKTVEKEQTYDLTKAKELVDKYYVSFLQDNIFTFGIDLGIKNWITFKNIPDGYKTAYNCNTLYENDANAKKEGENGYTITLNTTIEELKGKFNYGGCDLGNVDTYKYDDVNKVYKELFGKNENIPKSDYLSTIIPYDYIESENIFVKLNSRGGGAIGPHFTTYGVQNAKVEGENLIVDVGYIFIWSPTTDDTAKLTATIGGEEITLSTNEVQKEGFEKEFQEKYLDKLDTYRFTFKYEDDHYIFVDMKKV